jgi:hypothetical protein
MKAILFSIIVVWCNIFFLSDSRTFEPKLFIALGELKKVSKEAHGYKKQLTPETIIKHDMMQVQVSALIDDIVTEIEEGNFTSFKEELKNINAPLKELQLYLDRDKKNDSNITIFSQKNYIPFNSMEFTLKIINDVIEEVIETRKESREIKKNRIALLKTYKWEPIQE